MSRMPGRGPDPLRSSSLSFSAAAASPRDRAGCDSAIGRIAAWRSRQKAAGDESSLRAARETDRAAASEIGTKPSISIRCDCRSHCSQRREESAGEPEADETVEDPAAADVRRAFSVANRVRSRPVSCCAPAADRKRIGAVVRALPRAPNGSRAMTRGASSVCRQQVPPPRIGFSFLRHRQDADRGLAFGDRSDHLVRSSGKADIGVWLP